jgi:hypothetical protein
VVAEVFEAGMLDADGRIVLNLTFAGPLSDASFELRRYGWQSELLKKQRSTADLETHS